MFSELLEMLNAASGVVVPILLLRVVVPTGARVVKANPPLIPPLNVMLPAELVRVVFAPMAMVLL